MSYFVRLMRKEDISQVTEIDREAFPTQWPVANYEYELRNRLAHYIVACDEEKTIIQPDMRGPSKKGLSGLASKWRQLFGHQPSGNELPPSSRDYIIGFAGFWVMADEAHITSIAVQQAYRRKGIGELLLIYLIDQAVELKAHIATLEVRASNAVAQGLYVKYGFTRVGIRRGYYTDRGYNIESREDGIVMSTQDITLATFQTRLQQLKQAHFRKCGVALNQIVG